MYYFVSKKPCKWEVLQIDIDSLSGYKVNPKNKIKNGIKVNEMIIVNRELIKKILKKKVRIMLENLDEESSGDTRKALDHVQRYKKMINDKYSEFLEPKYISLLNQKMDILEREFKSNLILDLDEYEDEYEEYQEYEMEEKSTRRSR